MWWFVKHDSKIERENRELIGLLVRVSSTIRVTSFAMRLGRCVSRIWGIKSMGLYKFVQDKSVWKGKIIILTTRNNRNPISRAGLKDWNSDSQLVWNEHVLSPVPRNFPFVVTTNVIRSRIRSTIAPPPLLTTTFWLSRWIAGGMRDANSSTDWHF